MAISSLILKSKPADRPHIIEKLKEYPQLSLEGESPAGELILLVEADNLSALHKMCLSLEEIPGVLGIYPSYVTTDDEET